VRATSVTASSAVILEEPFRIVKDRAATSRAAAAEAMSLAKAAALAAAQAAALAETSDLSVLGDLDALSRKWWHVSPSSGAVAAAQSSPTTPSLSHPGDLRADPVSEWQGVLQSARSPTDIFQQYIADKQRLSATFPLPLPCPRRRSSAERTRGSPRGRLLLLPCCSPGSRPGFGRLWQEGKRGPKERRSIRCPRGT